jgi:hypothetical protein
LFSLAESSGHNSVGGVGANAKPFGRTLAGVLSGAAANLRSKLSNLSAANVNIVVGGSQNDLSTSSSPGGLHYHHHR